MSTTTMKSFGRYILTVIAVIMISIAFASTVGIAVAHGVYVYRLTMEILGD